VPPTTTALPFVGGVEIVIGGLKIPEMLAVRLTFVVTFDCTVCDLVLTVGGGGAPTLTVTVAEPEFAHGPTT
jgi:hypothetical protein